MIKIQIIDSIDLLSIGIHHFDLHHITIGKSLGNTIAISDPKMNKNHISLKLNKTGLNLFSHDSYLHNMKLVNGNINLKHADEVKIGDTIIKVLDFNISCAPNENDYYEIMEKIGNDDPRLSALFDALEEVYIESTGE